MDNTMKVGVTQEQRDLTKKAFMTFSYGGQIEVETSPNMWTRITTPLDFLRADTQDSWVGAGERSLDFSKLTHNYRPID